MNKNLLMTLLAVICAVLGFFIANNILGTHLKAVSIKAEDSVYSAPSVTAESVTGNFKPGETVVVLDKIELKKPTAVVMSKDLLLDASDHAKYQLKKGDVYALADAKLEQHNVDCVVRVQTDTEGVVELQLPKNAAVPVDEGTWLHVRKKGGKQKGWVRMSTEWY